MKVTVQVPIGDATLVRKLAQALRDPTRATQTRAMLRDKFGRADATGFKALLASAPLEGVDLTRQRDFGRPDHL